MLLKYDVGILGVAKLEQALAGIERRFVRHNANLNRIVRQASGGSTGGPRDPRSAARASRSDSLRNLAEIGNAARAGYYRDGREQIAIAKRVEREKLSAIKREERARVQAARAAAREESKARDKFRSGLGGRVRGVGSALAGVGAAVGGGAALVGGFAVGSKIQKEVEIEQRIRQLRIAGRGPGQAGVSDADIRGSARSASLATGVSETDAVAGMQAFVAKTGDLKTARANLQNFSTIAKATGSNVEDVASAAADLSEKFDLKKPEEMAEALAGLAFQGKKGAFELRDMASQFPKLAAAAERFGFKGAKGVRQLGGMAQIARSTTGSGEQAATAVEATLRQIGVKADDLIKGKTLGKKVDVGFLKDPKKKARDADAVLTDIISASGGDVTKLQKLFGDEGIKGISKPISAYREAYSQAGGGKKGEAAGRKAVEDVFKNAIDGAGGFKDAQTDAADALKTTASQLEILNTKIQEAIGSKLLPAFNRMLPGLEKLIPLLGKTAEGVAKFVNFLAENPWKGLGLIVAAVVTKSLLGAGIGAAVRNTITSSIRGGGGGAPTGPVRTTAAGALGAAGLGLDLGAAVGAGITVAGIGMFEGSESAATEGGKRNLAAKKATTRAELVKNLEKQRLLQQRTDPSTADGWKGAAFKALSYTPLGFASEKLLVNPATSSAKRTQESNVAAAEKMLADFDAKGAGQQFAEAAKAGGTEAGKAIVAEIKAGGLNRTDSPTAPRPN